MRLTLAALALFATIATASAGVTCRQYGNSTYCTNGHGGSVTCRQYGNQTYCQ